jgi:PhnB protein
MMNQIYNTFRPTGFGRVSVYLFREDPKALIDFLQKAFYAEEID